MLRRLAHALPFSYGWVVVSVAFVTLGLGANARGTFGLLFPSILKEFGWDRGDTAFIFSLGFMAAAVCAPLFGAALDRFGPNRVLPVGTCVVTAGFVLSTFCTQIWQFFITLGLMVVSASTTLSYNSHFIFLPNWFEKRRGLAIGAACTGVGTSAILLFPWMQATIDHAGWRTACIGLGTLLFCALVPLNLLFQRRRPQDLGLLPDGRRESPAQAASPVGGPPPTVPVGWTLKRAARTAPFWLMAGMFYSALFAWYAILVHQTKYLQDLGFGTEFASYALGLVPLFGVTGQLSLGALSDRIGREWIWTIGCLGFALCYAVLILLSHAPSHALVWLMVLAQGGLGYSIVSVYGAIPADVFRGGQYGLIFGCLSFFGSLGASSGPFVLGRVYDWTGRYDAGFLLAIGFSLLSVALVWLARARRPAG